MRTFLLLFAIAFALPTQSRVAAQLSPWSALPEGAGISVTPALAAATLQALVGRLGPRVSSCYVEALGNRRVLPQWAEAAVRIRFRFTDGKLTAAASLTRVPAGITRCIAALPEVTLTFPGLPPSLEFVQAFVTGEQRLLIGSTDGALLPPEMRTYVDLIDLQYEGDDPAIERRMRTLVGIRRHQLRSSLERYLAATPSMHGRIAVRFDIVADTGLPAHIEIECAYPELIPHVERFTRDLRLPAGARTGSHFTVDLEFGTRSD